MLSYRYFSRSLLGLLSLSAVSLVGCSSDSDTAASAGGAGGSGAAQSDAGNSGGSAGVGNTGGAAGAAGSGAAGAAGSGAAGAAGSGAAGSGAAGSGGAGAGGGTGAPDLSRFTCPANVAPLAAGMNQDIPVLGAKRRAIIDLPQDTSTPAAVMFSWYGYGEKVQVFRDALNFDPDIDPSVPVIVVTPQGTGLQPPAGLDWDISNQDDPQPNVDIAFFDTLLGCLNAQFNIDASRIYSFGFSAGSAMTGLLASTYPDVFAATVHMSGVWLNDPEEVKLVKIFTGIKWNWPPLTPQPGHVLLTHGGPNDVTILSILNLEESAQAAFPYLKANGRTVVDCGHNSGHTLDPGIPPGDIQKYLLAHEYGQPSPFLGHAGGPLPNLPERCVLRTP